MRIKHVLHRAPAVKPSLNGHNVESLKKAARFWVGKDSAQFKRDATVAALQKALADPQAGAAAFANLNSDEQRILSIFARYGTTVSGDLLQAELIARGLIEVPDRGIHGSYSRRQDA